MIPRGVMAAFRPISPVLTFILSSKRASSGYESPVVRQKTPIAAMEAVTPFFMLFP
jgi:hypothetical protein